MIPFVVSKKGSDEVFTVLSQFGEAFLLSDADGNMKTLSIAEFTQNFVFEELSQIPILEEELDDEEEDEETQSPPQDQSVSL